MASLLKSIGNWWRGKKDQMAEALKDPVRDGKIAIEDSEAKIQEFQSKIAKFMAANKQTQRDMDNHRAEVQKWSNIAQKAAASGNEADVMQAVEAKQRAETVLAEKTAQYESNAKVISQLRQQLQISAAKVAKAKSNYAQLVARNEGARVRKELAQAASDFGGSGPLAELNDLQKAVDADETEAEALEELAGANSGPDDLVDKYGASTSATVDDEVARLMAAAKKQA